MPRGRPSFHQADWAVIAYGVDLRPAAQGTHQAVDRWVSDSSGVNKLMIARLGEIFLCANLITEAQLEQAMAQQRIEGGRLGTILTKHGWVKEEDISRCLGEQYGIPYIDLDSHTIPPEVIH
jgi:hypothetical protein